MINKKGAQARTVLHTTAVLSLAILGAGPLTACQASCDGVEERQLERDILSGIVSDEDRLTHNNLAASQRAEAAVYDCVDVENSPIVGSTRVGGGFNYGVGDVYLNSCPAELDALESALTADGFSPGQAADIIGRFESRLSRQIGEVIFSRSEVRRCGIPPAEPPPADKN